MIGQADTRRIRPARPGRKIKTAYARYFQAVGQTQFSTKPCNSSARFERLVVQRYSVGLVPQQDAVRAQSRAPVSVDLVESERRRRDAAAKLNALLPRDADAPLAEPVRLATIPATQNWRRYLPCQGDFT